MPRVDSNYYAIDISQIFKLTNKEIKELIDWALNKGSYFVTQPSIIIIDAGKKIRYALGIGSIVVDAEPPVSYLKIVGSEWIDACKIGNNSIKEVYYAKEPFETIRGLLISLELKSPFLAINGIKTELNVNKDQNKGVPIVIIRDNTNNSHTIVSIDKDHFYINVDEFNFGKIIHYIAELISHCERQY